MSKVKKDFRCPTGIEARSGTLEDSVLQDSTEFAADAGEAVATSPRSRWLKSIPEIVMLGLCLALWVQTNEFTSSVGGPGPAMYPRVLISLLAFAMVVRLYQPLRGGTDAANDDEDFVPEEGAELDEALIDSRRVWTAIALAVGYVLATIYLGWLIATFIFTIVFLVLAGKRNPLIIVPAAFVFSFGMTYVFVKIVYISLPTGVAAFDVITVRLFEIMGIY